MVVADQLDEAMTKNRSSHAIKLKDRNLYLNDSEHPIRLRPKEARLLAVLLCQPNQVVSRATLMQEVWETDFLDDTRTLDVHISWLRRKIEDDPIHPRRLVTIRGIGYCLMVDEKT
jgi:DNA-binding response OmpR family regulator